MEAPAMRLSPEMRSYLHRNFPTLLVALPQAVRSMPGALSVVVRRFLRGMTRRRMIAVGVFALLIGFVELPRGLIEMRRRRLESIAAEHESKMICGVGCSRRGPPSYFDRDGRLMTEAEVKAAGWHAKLAVKYRTAATKPWLAVDPDPPPP
jgi:hypothetical protein